MRYATGATTSIKMAFTGAIVIIGPRRPQDVEGPAEPWPSHPSFRIRGKPVRDWHRRVRLQSVPEPGRVRGRGQRLQVKNVIHNRLLISLEGEHVGLWSGLQTSCSRLCRCRRPSCLERFKAVCTKKIANEEDSCYNRLILSSFCHFFYRLIASNCLKTWF